MEKIGPSNVERRLDETLAMLAIHKRRHAQKLAADDDAAALSELTAIAKLELTLANIEQYERIRALTVRE